MRQCPAPPHRALATRAGLFLLLEDDLRFHPRLRRHLAAWPALRAPDFALGSLCNLGLAAAAVRPAERSVHIAPGCYIGGQALVLTRALAAACVAEWEQEHGGPELRIAAIAARRGPIRVHAPSLVAHARAPSTWGGCHHAAADFDPAWEPAPAG